VTFALTPSPVAAAASPGSPGGLSTAAALYIANNVAFGLAVSQLLRHAGAVVKLFSNAGAACLVVAYSATFGLDLGRSPRRTLAFAGIAIFASLFIFVTEGERARSAGRAAKGLL